MLYCSGFRRFFQTFPVLALLAGLTVPVIAREPPGQAHIRLIDGGKEGNTYLAVLEISLAPGYLTYWRTPGDAGIPPHFDWSASGNVSGVSVFWPAPKRMLEADTVVYAFHDRVRIPLRVTPESEGDSVRLNLTLQYGVCKEICIPVTSSAVLSLKGVSENPVIVRQAFLDLPKPVSPGADAPLAILSGSGMKEKREAIVTVRAPSGEKPELFAEGPEGWLYSTSESRPGNKPDTAEFTVKLESSPKREQVSPPVRLTLRAGIHSIETTAPLD